jgi:cyclase
MPGAGSAAARLLPLGSTMRMLRPAPNVLAFYDGRIAGARTFAATPNWVDDGAYELGVASYAVVDGDEALVYDTHISVPHARLVRQALADAGARKLRVVLSHAHLDHVAGNAVFAGCEIIAHAATLAALCQRKAAIESGAQSGAPAIDPLVLPTRTYEGSLALTVGRIPVELRHVDIHSHDGTMLVPPDRGLLLAGDALEDPVTYIAEPDRLEVHLRDLARMAGWGLARILPNHGAEATIAGGGYGPELIGATERYLRALLRCRDEPERRRLDLRAFVADDLAAGTIGYWAPYEAVHRRNVAAVCAA